MNNLNLFNSILKKALISLLFLGTHTYGGLMEYKAIDNKTSIFGTLNIKGSHNVARLIRQWIPSFQKIYPNVKSNMDFKNSTQGINALINYNANMAVTSREIDQKEINRFKYSRGYSPTEIKISMNALAIYVNRQNTINGITLAQIDAIFSTSLNRGYKNKIDNWKDITNIDNKINIYLYDKNSTTYRYFLKEIMRDGTFNKKNLISGNFMGFLEAIDKVAQDKNGISFGSVGNMVKKNHKVKALSISKKENFPLYKPNNKNIKTRRYPLTRFFYIYLDIPPDRKIPKVIYEFCKYIFSVDGQKVVLNQGELNLGYKQIGIELSKIRR
jgi:phosphate transport system substrate-binding protein